MDEPQKPTLLERLSALLLREPEDREQLISLLRSAHENNLLDVIGGWRGSVNLRFGVSRSW